MRPVVLTVDVIVHEHLELHFCYAVHIFERLIQYHEVHIALVGCEIMEGEAFVRELAPLLVIIYTYDAEFRVEELDIAT